MNHPSIAHQRLLHQRIAQSTLEQPSLEQPSQVVQWLGAMQAQDYRQALWAVAARTTSATQADVELAIQNRSIVLTWPMRGTMHFVAAPDVRWLLELCALRKTSSNSARWKQLELDDRLLERCEQLFRTTLTGGKALTRAAMLGVLDQAGIDPAGQRGYHILGHLARTGLLCFGPKQGKEQTFVLLEEWIPSTPQISREAALAKLAQRYFTSHGPATVQDFTHWTGLTLGDARAGLESIRAKLSSEKVNGLEYWWLDQGSSTLESPAGQVHLLPGFDEYILGYKDRRDVLATSHAQRIVPGGNGVFFPMIVVDGQVLGTWKSSIKRHGLEVSLEPFLEIDGLSERVQPAVERYRQFLDVPLLDLRFNGGNA
jgi:Winged helix DNA-binding domain